MSTTGSDLDPDGYIVNVDGTLERPVASTGTVVISELSPGLHEVELDSLAANCDVAGSNPRSISVPAGSSASTTFVVNCVPLVGDLEITAVTTGSDPDPDGYAIRVDGGPERAIEANGLVKLTALTAGPHEVALTGVAANCTVDGSNPRTVSVPADGVTQTLFSVSCAALRGDLVALTSTTGLDLDPDGYAILLDGGPPEFIGVNASATFHDLAPGDHTIELTQVAANCHVSGANPRGVSVPAGGSVQTTFEVACAQHVGSLEVSTVTWGLGIDGNGYSVSVDGGPASPIGVNDTRTITALPEGSRQIELVGVAGNCSVQGLNPRMETITEGQTTSTAFEIFCWQNLVNRIVFESRRDAGQAGEIYIMNPDGSGQTNLTRHADLDREPDVAPDGSAVVFESDRSGVRNIWIMDVAGFRNLTIDGNVNRSPSFSASGTQIAYARASSTSWQIWKINRSGSGPQALTDNGGDDEQPAWSPDGTLILFRSTRADPNGDIWVMDADGTDLTRLTTDPANEGKPSWSSDGARIAWTSDRDGTFDVWRADFDASSRSLSNLVNLTASSPGTDGKSDWRPGQSQIAYATDSDGDNEILIMNGDGTGKIQITNNGFDDREPSWTP